MLEKVVDEIEIQGSDLYAQTTVMLVSAILFLSFHLK